MERIGEKIYKLRRQEGYSQEELGYKLKVTRQTVSQWEANTLQPKSEKLKILCEVFDVKPDFFLFNENLAEVCEEALTNEEVQEEIQENYPEVKRTPKAKVPAKIKALVWVTGVLLLLSVVFFIVAVTTMPPQKGLETVTSVTVNFSFSNVMLIVSSVVLIAVIVLLVVILITLIRRKK